MRAEAIAGTVAELSMLLPSLAAGLPGRNTLLGGRVRLTFQSESKLRGVYWLVVGKKGSKMKQSTAAAYGMTMGIGMMTCTKMPMSIFAHVLSSYVHTEVVEKTGLTGD